jgi:hypothetical protein
LQSLVPIARKGTFRSKGSIAGRGASNSIPSNVPSAKGTFSTIRMIPGHGSIGIISTNERRQVWVMVPGFVTGHEPLKRAAPGLAQWAHSHL